MNGEPAAHELVNVVDFGALEILGTELVDEQLDAFLTLYQIAFEGRIFESHPVLETGAATRGDEYPQPEVGQALRDAGYTVID